MSLNSFTIDFDFSFPSDLLQYEGSIYCLGSCFAEHMAERLEVRKFKVLSNPFGILYNPVSMAQSLLNVLHEKEDQEPDLLEYSGYFYAWDFHSKIHAQNPADLLQLIRKKKEESRAFLRGCKTLILTFGSAYAWQHKGMGRIIANCHKQPKSLFEKQSLGVDQMLSIQIEAVEALRKINPEVKIITTVSPVRYLRDGLVASNRSKARLHLLCEELEATFSAVHYFPAYEIVMDELRDYRFYERDRVHPSTEAVDYVWERLSALTLSQKDLQIMQEVEKVHRMLSHKVMHPNSKEYQKFTNKLLHQINGLSSRYTFLNYDKERAQLVG